MFARSILRRVQRGNKEGLWSLLKYKCAFGKFLPLVNTIGGSALTLEEIGL
jgi:hypothetical protein